MATKGKKRRKGKIRVRQKARIVKKDSINIDSLPKMKARSPADVAPTLKIKIKKR